MNDEESIPMDKEADVVKKEEELEIEELEEEELEEEEPPEQAVGLISHLNMVGDKLLEVLEYEKDEETKIQKYQIVAQILEEDGSEIQGMIEELNEEVPEKVSIITKEIDEKFAMASNYFLDAIEYYFEFLDTENAESIQKAKESVKEGARILEEADAKAQELTSVPDGTLEA
ncbi:MAG: hypothetical protein K8T10_15055 [Candidatus Eremiobacteraeota bacterium]|nr:hypothetical protein [Candidatus Eremiobacteraeota bacterium]